jgi:hypothetical protein
MMATQAGIAMMGQGRLLMILTWHVEPDAASRDAPKKE